GGPDAAHPFGRGQEKFFWALVSAVSVFFVGCGVNLYHGFHALVQPTAVAPFTLLVLGLLIFSLVLEASTFVVALREIGGWKGIVENRNNTTVLAVLLEDAVALIGILLTLLVGGISYFYQPNAVFDAVVAISVGVMLGAMALFLAALNRRLLIDTADADLDRTAAQFLADAHIPADATSILIDDDRAIVFVHARARVDSHALGEALKAHVLSHTGKTVAEVYWQFPQSDSQPVT
ncbi:MAG TPA: cation transporter, partial [Actinomycetota bacterium]|nr:cation transporter [Actinomycetota bacterium]